MLFLVRKTQINEDSDNRRFEKSMEKSMKMILKKMDVIIEQTKKKENEEKKCKAEKQSMFFKSLEFQSPGLNLRSSKFKFGTNRF